MDIEKSSADALAVTRRIIDKDASDDGSDKEHDALLSAYAVELAEHYEAIDGWLRAGGFLPRRWSLKRPTRKAEPLALVRALAVARRLRECVSIGSEAAIGRELADAVIGGVDDEQVQERAEALKSAADLARDMVHHVDNGGAVHKLCKLVLRAHDASESEDM